MLRFILAAALIASTAPGLAHSQDGIRVAPDEASALQSYARKIQGQTALEGEVSDLIEILRVRIVEAQTLAERGASREEAERWAEGWRGPLRSEIESLEARARALPRIEPSDLVGHSPAEIRELMSVEPDRRLAGLRLLESLKPLADRLDRLAVRAAAGDEDALESLAAAMIDGTKAAIQAENRSLQIELRLGDSTHPANSLTLASIATNDALLVVLDVRQALDEGRPFNARSQAGRIGGHAEAIRTAADRMERLSRIMAGSMEATAQPEDREILVKVREMFATYPESAAVERDVAKVFDEVAANLKRTPIDPEFGAPLEDIGLLIDRRISLQDQRNRAIAN